jgi:hypothetical protein
MCVRLCVWVQTTAIETHAPLHSLSALERERNSFGTPIEFVYDESNAEQFVASVRERNTDSS